MNESETSTSGCNSRDSVVLIIDGPIDDEVRPCRPSLLPLLKAESEKLKRYQAMMKELETKHTEPPPQSS